MFARGFIAFVFLSLLGLAALEMKTLWPLLGESPAQFTLQLVGRVSLAVDDKRSNLSGLAVTPSGTVWVADRSLDRLLAVDPDGRVLDEFSAKEPTGISAAGEAVLIIDPYSGLIRRIALGEGVTRTWDASPHGLYVPRGVAALGDGGLVIAATGSSFVCLLGGDGQEKGRLGVSKDGRGELLGPDYPLVDQYGRVYISDGNIGVRRWTAEGRPDATFRTRDRVAGVLSDPRQTALDSRGRLWVADAAAGRVWLFDSDGGLLGFWQDPSVGHPEGLAIWRDRLYLTSRDSNDLYMFELPRSLEASQRH
jgi:DNA-binding beta-propeller fold protein YncE